MSVHNDPYANLDADESEMQPTGEGSAANPDSPPPAHIVQPRPGSNPVSPPPEAMPADLERRIQEEVEKRMQAEVERRMQAEVERRIQAAQAQQVRKSVMTPNAGTPQQPQQQRSSSEVDQPSPPTEAVDAAEFNATGSEQTLPRCDTQTRALEDGLLTFEDDIATQEESNKREPTTIEAAVYVTRREEGRCTRPSRAEEAVIPPQTHVSVILGFYGAKQTIMTCSFNPKAALTSRDDPISSADAQAFPVAQTRFTFEADLTKGDSLGSPLRQDPHEGLIGVEDVRTSAKDAITSTVKRFKTADVLEVWERARNKPPPEQIGGATIAKLWCSDYEPSKPIPAVPMFSGGTLYQVDVKSITTMLQMTHGPDCDPLFCACAIYNVSSPQVVKVSETCHFGIGFDSFFPHKNVFPSQRFASFTTFIPNELRTQPLHLLIRLYRLASDDFEEYVDAYVRPDRIKPPQMGALKQKTQMLAAQSDFLQELGWYAVQLVDRGKLLQGPGTIEKLYRPANKSTNDSQVMDYILHEPKRASLKIIPCRIEINCTDVSNYEISFPQHGDESCCVEEEHVIAIHNTEVFGAPNIEMRYCPCCLPILNSGFFHSYSNAMYLRITSLNFNKFNSRSSAHSTYVVHITLKDNDDNLNEEGYPCFYGHALATSIVETSAWTTCTNNQKEIEFSDEYKVQLPLVLTERHHFLFTFYQVAFKRGVAGDRMLRVGYATLPVFAGSTLLVREGIQLPVIGADAMQPIAQGYLMKMAQLPPQSYINNGQPLYTLSVTARSTVYVTNPALSAVFAKMPYAIREIVKPDGVFSQSNILQQLGNPYSQGGATLTAILHSLGEVPLPELLAFFPVLTSFLLSIISSPCASLGAQTRCAAFHHMVEVSTKVQQWELAAKKALNKPATQDKKVASAPRTSLMVYLYHYCSNNLLFDETSFPLYAALVEVWSNELQGTDRKTQDGLAYLHRMNDLAWFLLDMVLRSSYFAAQSRKDVPRTQRAPREFYNVLRTFTLAVAEKLLPIGGATLASRLTVFLRNLMYVFDRGAVMTVCNTLLEVLGANVNNGPQNVNSAVRLLLDTSDSVTLSQLSKDSMGPRYLLGMCLDKLVPLMQHASRDIRVVSTNILYSHILNVVCNAQNTPDDLAALGRALLSVLGKVAPNYMVLKQQMEKDGAIGLRDRRQFLVIFLWALSYQSDALGQWMQSLPEDAVNGFVTAVADCFSVFRYNAARDKCDTKPKPEQVEDLALWDARHAAITGMVCCDVGSRILDDLKGMLCTVKDPKPSGAVYAYFQLIEGAVSLHNSTAVLQVAAALLYRLAREMFPELVSGKGRMMSGMVLVTVRLMSCSSTSVQQLSSETFLEMARRCYDLFGSLARLKLLVTNALVSVAEATGRDLSKAGEAIEKNLASLCSQVSEAQQQEEQQCDAAYRARYEEGGSAAVDSAVACSPMFPTYTNVTQTIEVSPALLQSNAELARREMPPFGEQLKALCDTMSSLFTTVVQLQVDDSMKYKESKCETYRNIASTFLKQNSLKDGLKWLNRLYDTHKSNNDYIEAGMVQVYMAAMGYRVTQLLYKLQGQDCKMCRLPVAFFSYVYWQDYVRILPEVEEILSPDNLYQIASDLTAVPDEKPFTVDGQSLLLKEASENFGKGQIFELSLMAIRIVESIVWGKGDFRSLSVVHSAMQQWANAIANFGSKRLQCKYFYLGVTHKNDPNLNSRTIFRLPASTDGGAFRTYAKQMTVAGCGINESEVQYSDEKGPSRSVVIDVYEVQPYFEATAVKCERPPRLMDRYCFINTFHFSRRSELVVKKDAWAARSRGSTAPTMDVGSQTLKLITHTTKRCFPSMTTSIEVATTAETTMTAAETALETIREQLDRVSQTTAENENVVNVMFTAMTPMDITPPGSYYKAVIAAMHDQPSVMRELKELLAATQERMEAGGDKFSEKYPEKYAQLLKATVDISCVLKTYAPPSVVSPAVAVDSATAQSKDA